MKFWRSRSFGDIGQRSHASCLSTFSNGFLSEITWAISFKFHMQPPSKGGKKISIFYGCMVWIEKSVTRVTDGHHKACRVMPNSDPE